MLVTPLTSCTELLLSQPPEPTFKEVLTPRIVQSERCLLWEIQVPPPHQGPPPPSSFTPTCNSLAAASVYLCSPLSLLSISRSKPCRPWLPITLRQFESTPVLTRPYAIYSQILPGQSLGFFSPLVLPFQPQGLSGGNQSRGGGHPRCRT